MSESKPSTELDEWFSYNAEMRTNGVLVAEEPQQPEHGDDRGRVGPGSCRGLDLSIDPGRASKMQTRVIPRQAVCDLMSRTSYRSPHLSHYAFGSTPRSLV